jgi:hypothetical protein
MGGIEVDENLFKAAEAGTASADLCNEIIAAHLPSSKSLSLDQPPTELLERLGPIEETVQAKNNQTNRSSIFSVPAVSVGP